MQSTHNLHVVFYKGSHKNEYLSVVEQRPFFEDKDFVRIAIPGNNTLMIDTLVEDRHKESYPVEWAQYQNSLNGVDAISGTPLKEWSLISPSTAENLKYFKFFTVEQIAQASDQQLQAVQHLLSMGYHALRTQAQYYLANAKENADVAKLAAEREEMRAQNEDLRLALVRMQTQMDEFMANASASPAPKKRGRKPKDVQVVQEDVAT